MNYVVGFLFSDSGDQVALIEKLKPAWQVGLLNGVGGKIESGEIPIEAMAREFEEETCAEVKNWRCFARLDLVDGKVWCFESHQTKKLKSPTNERVDWYGTHKVICGEENTIPNLPWLIQMALDRDRIFATIDYKRGA